MLDPGYGVIVKAVMAADQGPGVGVPAAVWV